MTYGDRRHACAFGAVAERYDRARPSYPAALISDLAAESPRGVLDVGCGTGKVGRLFLERGCRVLGIEPDPSMAAIARRRGVEVETASFEDWEPRGRRFDLVVAGQAWHWVDPEVGRVKAASVLSPGRRFGAFWNLVHHDPVARNALRPIYERFAPELLDGAVVGGAVLGTLAEKDDAELEALTAGGLFERPEKRTYGWRTRYTRRDWVELISTHSDHLVLEPERLAAVIARVGAVIDSLGGSITVRFESTVLTVTARGL